MGDVVKLVGKYNREVSKRKALRKQKKSKELYCGYEWYDNLHQYSKNKIHCSCSFCSTKTKNRGRAGWGYCRTVEYKTSDRRKIIKMDTDLKELPGEIWAILLYST